MRNATRFSTNVTVNNVAPIS